MKKAVNKKAVQGVSASEDTEFTPTKKGETETRAKETESQGAESFMELFEESVQSIREGKVVQGVIVRVDDEFVLVDIGYKSEGQIRIGEFTGPGGRLTAKVGDKIDVLLVRQENQDGRIILSREKAGNAKVWNDVEEAYKKQTTIRGRIVSLVKGGLCVDIGLRAFLPGSQADVRPIRDLNSLVGTEHDFKVVKYEKNQENIVLSRRAALEEELKSLRENTLARIEKDAVLEGVVTNIKDYGLFVDLGGVVGLLHITDMSWGKVSHPSSYYRVGDSIEVKILKFDKESGRVALGLKQMTPDPWMDACEKYPVNSRVKGKVIGLVDYGAFVEIKDGIEGLIQLSEMSWTEKVRHPSQILRVGDTVEAVILSIDAAKKRVSLSMKRTAPNPWDTIDTDYPVGATIVGKVKNISNFGLFVGIDQGIDGLVHISDISWTQKINHPSELYKKGDEVQAVILDIDKENERFSLGIKQLTPDPWDRISGKYNRGDTVSGIVKSIAEFGVFVELEPGIEGLIHISQLPAGDKDKNPLEGFHVNDEIRAEVVHISQKDKKIGLSVRKLQEDGESSRQSAQARRENQATSNLGELLKEKMMDLRPNASPDSPDSESDA